METHKDTLAALRAFNRNVDWLKVQALKNAPAEKWGSYEDAYKILPRSKHWFQMKRNGGYGLFAGKDFRRVGGQIEYRLAAIEDLKKSITT